jgi:hypothetical protein
MGRFLLDAQGDQFAGEEFLGCRQLQGDSDFALITMHLLICVATPSLPGRSSMKWMLVLDEVIETKM